MINWDLERVKKVAYQHCQWQLDVLVPLLESPRLYCFIVCIQVFNKSLGDLATLFVLGLPLFD